MADLEFSKKVPGVQAGQQLPAPYHREQRIEVTAFPDFQSAVSNYANSTNWMSWVGSSVAASASNELAQRMGSELGKNPQGNIILPLTDFDKTMQQNYLTQAKATLSLQANKLITDSNVELSKVPRLSPDLIQKTNDSIAKGVQGILKNAPDSVKNEMENQLGNVMLSQNASLTERMYREQKEDQRNNNANASAMNAEQAYSFGLNGNEKAGLKAIETTQQLNEASLAARLITPANAKSNIDSVRQSYQSGKLIHGYEVARSQGKGEAYLKSLADKKPGYISDADYLPVTQNLLNYISNQNSLRSQDQSLALAKFNTSLAMNPTAPDMASQLQNLKEQVSAQAYEGAQLKYINAIKTHNKEQGNLNDALSSWNDPSSFARLTEKGINKAFDVQVNRLVQQTSQDGNPITVDDAEVQVAASAGGRVPVFEKTLTNKLLSGNPANILSAANQIESLDKMEAGRVYSGVPATAKAIGLQFTSQRGSMPDNDLARKITDNLSNIDSSTQKTLDNAWSLKLSLKGAGGMGATKPLYKFALDTVGKDIKELGGQYFGVIYGNDIYNNLYSNFITTRGDYETAVKMTKDYVKDHYGDTYINGNKQFSDSPIEKYLGYKGDDATPYIQHDLINQLSDSFKKSKENYPDDYWETLPLKGGTVEAVRTIKTGKTEKKYRYPINLVGKAGNQWDVVVQTPYGPRNLFLVAPHLGVTTYEPNKEAIDKDFKQNGTKDFAKWLMMTL